MLILQKILYKVFMNILHPVQIRYYRELVKKQNESYENLEIIQLDKLNKLLNYSYQNVPFYKKIFDSCALVHNGKIHLGDLKELGRLPLLSKELIRKEGVNLYSREHKQRESYRNSSGGTTGEPVVFMQDKYYADKTRANFLLGKKWQGLSLYDSEIVLWGAERDTFTGKKPFISYLKDFITNRMLLNCFVMSKEDMRRYLKIINENNKTVLRGYAEQLYELAKFANSNKIIMNSLRAVHSTAGNLRDFMREEIESAFGCRVYNYYGSREAGAIASECGEHKGLHIFMDHNIVEIINAKGEVCQEGEMGGIVITNLNNFSMPLIRYKIGDMGTISKAEKCNCGCSYPKLAGIAGRTSDLFITREGKIIDSDFITPLFFFRDWIKKFQIIQKKYDQILIKIVKQGECEEEEIEELTAKIKKVMGQDCEVLFDFVDKIPKSKTGKIRYTICEVEKS